MIGRSLCGLLVATACTADADPVTPCGAVDVGEAEPSVMVSGRLAPVLAISDDPLPAVVHWICPEDEDSCALATSGLPGVGAGDPLMITSAGNYLLAIVDTQRVAWFQLGATGIADHSATSVIARRFITSLRASDWVLLRNPEGQLERFRAGGYASKVVADELAGVTVVAVGEQWVVGRTIRDNDSEMLHLIAVDEALPDPDAVTPLIVGPEFSRVLFSAADQTVIATSGQGGKAQTYVMTVPDGLIVDRFVGEMVSGRVEHEELPGLRSISPDGSRLAYRTAQGSVAMRDLDAHRSCLVRRAPGQRHTVAGFSADGLLFMEARADNHEGAIFAWDPATRELHPLTSADEGFRLAAAPAVRAPRPWAIAVRGGEFAAVQAGTPSYPLGFDDAMFMPRDDARVWLADSSLQGTVRTLTLRSIAPTIDPNARVLRFGPDVGAVVNVSADGNPPAPFEREFSGQQNVCLSTGLPGSRASQCGSPQETPAFTSHASPEGEDPYLPDALDPDQNDLPGHNQSCGSGTPWVDAPSCPFYLARGSCCYTDLEAACEGAGCDLARCSTLDESEIQQVVCGQSSAPPQPPPSAGG